MDSEMPDWVLRLNEAVRRWGQSPRDGIELLLPLRDHPEVKADADAEHTVLHMCVALLVNQQTDLELAERLAKRLLELCPDQMHHHDLAQIYRLRGAHSAALESDVAASSAPIIHMTPEVIADYEWAIAIVDGEQSKSK